jgi:hypothetical protein
MVFCCQAAVFAQRGVGVMKTNPDGSKQEVKLYDGSYALVIGNSDYSMGWNRLGGVKSDIAAVRDVLERHGFKVEVEENLTSERFEPRIRKFINDYGYDRDNRLMIYYAGHGHTLNSVGDKRDLGYIIPTDTPLPDKDPRGFRQKAVSMYAIQTFARDIQAKHAMFVFDSCFSGKLFALRNKPWITPFILDKVDRPVRQFITAGDETQAVPDESVFRKAFVRGLEGDADRNKDGYIVGTELAEYLKEAVTNYSNRRQTPQYGTINDIDLDRGDLVFSVADYRPSIAKIFIENSSIPKPQQSIKPETSKTPEETKTSSDPDLQPYIVKGLRGKKSGKILYVSNRASAVEDSQIVPLMEEFDSVVISKLKSNDLDVATGSTFSPKDHNQMIVGLNNRAKDEKGLRFLPYALVIYTSFGKLRDMPEASGLKIAVVSGGVNVYDTENAKVIASEYFSDVRGFGNTQYEARMNALKTAGQGISEKFIKAISEKAR